MRRCVGVSLSTPKPSKSQFCWKSNDFFHKKLTDCCWMPVKHCIFVQFTSFCCKNQWFVTKKWPTCTECPHHNHHQHHHYTTITTSNNTTTNTTTTTPSPPEHPRRSTPNCSSDDLADAADDDKNTNQPFCKSLGHETLVSSSRRVTENKSA